MSLTNTPIFSGIFPPHLLLQCFSVEDFPRSFDGFLGFGTSSESFTRRFFRSEHVRNFHPLGALETSALTPGRNAHSPFCLFEVENAGLSRRWRRSVPSRPYPIDP